MKKILSIFAIAVFSFGLLSCEADNSAEDQALYELGTGGDDTPDDPRDSTGGDSTPPDNRDSTGGDDTPVDPRESGDN